MDGKLSLSIGDTNDVLRFDGRLMNHHLLWDSHNLVAIADMRGNLVAVAVLLVFGVIVLRLVSPIPEISAPRWWLVATAFVSGPTASLVWFASDVLWISPYDYFVPKDYAMNHCFPF